MTASSIRAIPAPCSPWCSPCAAKPICASHRRCSFRWHVHDRFWEACMFLTHEHEEIRSIIRRWIAKEVNPYVDEWEAAEIFPAHQVFRQMGELGLLGLNKPVDSGG